MLIDLLNSQNYIMVNIDAIQILGLNNAVYCAELLNVYKKAYLKSKTINEEYFKIDREFIKSRTSLSIEDQLKCDINLIKANIIKKSDKDPDIIHIDVETFASILSSENVKLLKDVSKKVKIENPKGTKEAKKERIVAALKNSIVCNNFELLKALHGWIDAIVEKTGSLSKVQVDIFKQDLKDYAQDLDTALEVVKIATIHQYVDCKWAINTYERSKQISKNGFVGNYSNNYSNNVNQVRVTEQQKADLDDLSDQVF